MPHFSIKDGKLIDILVENKICSSRREANEFLKNEAISINGDIVKDANFILNGENALEGKIIIIRRGKKKYFVMTLNND